FLRRLTIENLDDSINFPINGQKNFQKWVRFARRGMRGGWRTCSSLPVPCILACLVTLFSIISTSRSSLFEEIVAEDCAAEMYHGVAPLVGSLMAYYPFLFFANFFKMLLLICCILLT
uniref:Uncharacterized protein n=1 Tax=Parascaris univalens TaxID=6257 RepID=A0A915AH52_PARUN